MLSSFDVKSNYCKASEVRLNWYLIVACTSVASVEIWVATVLPCSENVDWIRIHLDTLPAEIH